jgi:GT2 family glycosyltransferase
LARGLWLVFTDDDCLAERGWLAALIDRIGRPPECSVLEGKTVPDRRRLRLDEESPANTAGGYLWSCNMAIRRSFFERLGGFCETFPYATMEDIDLALRVLGAGERFEFVPGAVVCHPYRTAKGVRFLYQAGASFLHLVERHPQLLGVHPWLTFCAVSLRRAAALVREGFACRGRGLRYGLAYFAVWTYFEFVARARRTKPLATVPSAWPTQHER